MPELLETKVYQLGQALLERIGKPRFEEFVAGLARLEKEVLDKKKKDMKKPVNQRVAGG